MLVPYFDGLSSSEEDIMSTITDIEREKMTTFYSRRDSWLDRACKTPRRQEPSLVLDDFLFLGNMENASNRELLDHFQIKHVLNVCDLDTDKTIKDNFNVIHIPMSDECDTNIKQHFDRTNKLLHDIYEQKQRCLVHCAAGVSRSATIVLAYLMKYHHNTLMEAYDSLLEKRPQVCPNIGFLLQLIRYEDDLIQSREINPNQSLNTEEENPIATVNEFENKHKND